MKSVQSIPLLLLLLLPLTACAKKPLQTNDGMDWQDDWISVGTALGVEPPGNGLTLLDNKDALSSAGLYYAAWAVGDKQDFVNAENETVDLYDAQVYLLLQDCKDEATASETVTDWQTAEESTYQVTQTQTLTCAGQTFTVLQYAVIHTDNPYSRGVSAFGVYQNHAISVEMSCQETFDGDELQILTEFLNGFHYAA